MKRAREHGRGDRRALERELRARLRAARAPDEQGAAARARRAVVVAHAAAPATARSGWRRPALALAAAVVLLVAVGAALTAPGQAIGDWLRDVVRPEPAGTPSRPATALPAQGRLLALRGDALTVVADGRAPVRLGSFRDATWSSRGRFVAVTTRDALLAVTPSGAVRWRVEPPAPARHPRWSPDGFRLAYLSGPQLRVIVGNGTDDRLFAGHARDVAPAFRPSAGRTVAWIDAAGHARVADVDRAVLLWRSLRAIPGARALSWSSDGRRLLVTGEDGVFIHDLAAGTTRSARGHGRVVAAAYPPAGAGAPALLERRGGRSALRLLGRREPLIETAGRYDGLTWSPDGRWLLTRWDSRWLLVRRDGRSVTTVPVRGRVLGWSE